MVLKYICHLRKRNSVTWKWTWKRAI